MVPESSCLFFAAGAGHYQNQLPSDRRSQRYHHHPSHFTVHSPCLLPTGQFSVLTYI